MKPPTDVPRVRDYFRMLNRYWFVVVCTTVLSMGAAWLAHKTVDAEYQASTQIAVVTPAGADVSDAYYGDMAASARALSIAELAKNPQIARRTIDELGLEQTPEEATKHIATTTKNTIVDIYVTGETPELALNTANSVTSNLLAVARETADLDRSGTELVLVDDASQVWETRAPLISYLRMGAALGFALGVVLVIVMGLARNSVLDKQHLARIVTEEVSERNP